MRTFRVEHLGCKVNQYEARALEEGLSRLGLQPAGPGGPADLHVLNTCSVTEHAGATSRKLVRRSVRESPGATVLVTGCYAESDRQRVEHIPGVTRVFGNAEKEGLLGWVASDLLHLPLDAGAARFRITGGGGQTRAFVKVEDGCDDRCTFCIIPRLRGPARSRPEDEVVAEVRDLVRAGHQEVVLTGVHLGYYGKETGSPRKALPALLRRLVKLPGLHRLKLSSIEVHEITSELVALFASEPVLSPHLHLPLQSGSDNVLRLMRRKYNRRLFLERVLTLRERLVEPALSTDVIVGFPGEGDADFEDTLEVVRRAGFMKVHVFPYSPRAGTAAAGLEGALPAEIVAARKQRLLEVDALQGAAFRRGFLGRRVEVLVEGRRDSATGLLTGLTERYLRVLLPGPDRLQGHLVDVRVLRDGEAGAVLGELVTEGVAA